VRRLLRPRMRSTSVATIAAAATSTSPIITADPERMQEAALEKTGKTSARVCFLCLLSVHRKRYRS
jgi:hypothetical protein